MPKLAPSPILLPAIYTDYYRDLVLALIVRTLPNRYFVDHLRPVPVVSGRVGADYGGRCSLSIQQVAMKSGGKPRALQTLREIRGRLAIAPAFGLRVLQHRF
jgi:hypothetical protein